MKALTFVFALALLALAAIASPAWSAPAWSIGCTFSGGDLTGTVGTGTGAGSKIGPGTVACYRYASGDGAHNSTTVTVTAPSAVITFDPQLDAAVAAATAALVIPHYCPQGSVLTAANPERSCVSIGGAGANAALDGVEGASASQNAAIRVGPGLYYLEVSGACLAGDTCQVTVRGEN